MEIDIGMLVEMSKGMRTGFKREAAKWKAMLIEMRICMNGNRNAN